MSVYNPDNPNYFDGSGGDGTVYPGGSSSFNESTGTYNPPNEGAGNTPGVNMSGLPGGIQQVGQWLTGSNNPLTNAKFLPAIAQAIQQWHDANQYKQLGMDAANRSDPFGKYRGYYGDMLQGLYSDPSKIADTPGYKFALNQALDATTNRLGNQGFLGSSQMQAALASQASGMAQQTWNTEADRLARLAGSQFDPANAGRFMMEGGKLSVDAQNGALRALTDGLGLGGANGITINNNNGGGGRGAGSGGSGLRMPASQALQRLQQAGFNPRDAATLMRALISDPSSIDSSTMQILQDTGIIDPSNGFGGVDVAPGSYDSTGFGGWGTASGDPTLTGINFGGSFDPSNFNDVTGQTGFDPSNYISSDSPDMTGFQTSMTDLFGP